MEGKFCIKISIIIITISLCATFDESSEGKKILNYDNDTFKSNIDLFLYTKNFKRRTTDSEEENYSSQQRIEREEKDTYVERNINGVQPLTNIPYFFKQRIEPKHSFKSIVSEPVANVSLLINTEHDKTKVSKGLIHFTPDKYDLSNNAKKQNKTILESISLSNENTSAGTNIKTDAVEALNESIFQESTVTNKTFFFQNDANPLLNIGDDNQNLALRKNYCAFCLCDMKINECDINCCCDDECEANLKEVFTICDLSGKNSLNFEKCLQSKFFYNYRKNDAANHFSGLFQIVQNNFHPKLYKENMEIIEDATHFRRRKIGKKIYRYSSLQFDIPDIKKAPYQMDGYVWAAMGNKLIPFGVPTSTVNKQCKSVGLIHYLSDYSTECIIPVPQSKLECETTDSLKINFYMGRNLKILKSPILVKGPNATYKQGFCRNDTCVDITSYICIVGKELSSCRKYTDGNTVWDENVCMNVVSSVEYYIYHNGSNGIKDVRAYFLLTNISRGSADSFAQRIKVKFIWAETPGRAFYRSGNPGYVFGKPIMTGEKVLDNNETSSLGKEAIQVAPDPRRWLTVFGHVGGECDAAAPREPIAFGENLRRTCYVPFTTQDFFIRKCAHVQETIFKLFIGDDFARIKSDNRFNKFVATLGNSKGEETGDWTQVIIDLTPILSYHVDFALQYKSFVCKNIVTDLYIDVAFSNVGSVERPQAKILGVHMHFGVPKTIIHIPPNKLGDRGNSSHKVKLSSFVQFVDLTNMAQKEFSETPGIETKLPHDFFYPFFSSGCLSTSDNNPMALCVLFASAFNMRLFHRQKL